MIDIYLDKDSPKTNADRIRSMSDEELARIIMCPYDTEVRSIDDIPCAEHGMQMFVTPEECKKCCIKWLQSELEE